MIDRILYGLGVVAVFEGLVLALAPSHLRSVLEMLARLDGDRTRSVGLAAVTFGVILLWIAQR